MRGMRDMPDIEYPVSAVSGSTTRLDYDITVYLAASVGNECMGKELSADFRWWVEESGDSGDDSGGSSDGDDTTDPTDPVIPGEPTEPVDPVIPGEPTEPVEPTDPVTPGEPIGSTDPVTPFDPAPPGDNTEPGMTVEKPFFIENQSTCDVYYKIYLGEVAGGLADILEITVLDKDGGEICKGTASSLTRRKVIADDKPLDIGERRELKIRFHYPEDSGNASQDSYLQFVLCADAVQVRNNPDKEFGDAD